MSLEDVQAISIVVSVILVAIQAYLVYRVNSSKLALETYVGITKKSRLKVALDTQKASSEKIVLTNIGELPIDEINVKIDFSISLIFSSPIKFSSDSLHSEWHNKSILNPEEEMIIPLWQKLTPFLQKKKFLTTKNFEKSYTDSKTGKDKSYNLEIAELVKPFWMYINLEINSKIQGQSIIIKKKYSLNYDFKRSPFQEYEPNFDIMMKDDIGKWEQ